MFRRGTGTGRGAGSPRHAGSSRGACCTRCTRNTATASNCTGGSGAASSLALGFTATSEELFFNYVFASEEYSEFVDKNCVILNDIHIDIMDYISPASCTDAAFRTMWAEFEWENKVAVNTLNNICEEIIRRRVDDLTLRPALRVVGLHQREDPVDHHAQLARLHETRKRAHQLPLVW